ncbi:MAG: hypothetical protein JW740_00735 [Candidatus Zambryskibacteria bacterium]|nr:hypothetical protein [Candidatus Zambryskibacteria bacterium]
MIKKLINNFGFNWIFLFAVFCLYLVAVFLNIELFLKSLIKSKIILEEIVPVLILIFVLTFLANLFLTNKKADKILAKQSGPTGYLFAMILGIVSMGPIYMWYPLLSELKEKGLKNSLIAVFLYNRAVKIPLIPIIIYYFGVPFMIVTALLMMLFSVINGWLVSVFVKD